MAVLACRVKPRGILEQIIVRAAIHAAEALRGDDGKRGRDTVVEGINPGGSLVGECAGIDQGRSFTQWAMR